MVVSICTSFLPSRGDIDDSRDVYGTSTEKNHLGASKERDRNIYTVGMFEHGLPEVLVQDVPMGEPEKAVRQLIRRMVFQLESGQRLYTDKRIVENNRYCFRVIEVTHEDYRRNLLDHVMVKWQCQYRSNSELGRGGGRNVVQSDGLLRRIQILVVVPWFHEDMEEWGTLPRPPKNRYERRDKIFFTAMNLDCRGRSLGWNSWSSSSPSTAIMGMRHDGSLNSSPERAGLPLFDAQDAAYLLKYQDHFLRILGLPAIESIVYRMPESFQRQTLMIGERMVTDAALRLSQHRANHGQTDRFRSSSRASRGHNIKTTAMKTLTPPRNHPRLHQRNSCHGCPIRGARTFLRLSGSSGDNVFTPSPSTTEYAYF